MGVLENAVRDAAEERRDPGQSAGPHHDQVRVQLVGLFDDRGRDRATVRDPAGAGIEAGLGGQANTVFGELARRPSAALILARSVVRDGHQCAPNFSARRAWTTSGSQTASTTALAFSRPTSLAAAEIADSALSDPS